MFKLNERLLGEGEFGLVLQGELTLAWNPINDTIVTRIVAVKIPKGKKSALVHSGSSFNVFRCVQLQPLLRLSR